MYRCHWQAGPRAGYTSTEAWADSTLLWSTYIFLSILFVHCPFTRSTTGASSKQRSVLLSKGVESSFAEVSLRPSPWHRCCLPIHPKNPQYQLASSILTWCPLNTYGSALAPRAGPDTYLMLSVLQLRYVPTLVMESKQGGRQTRRH